MRFVGGDVRVWIVRAGLSWLWVCISDGRNGVLKDDMGWTFVCELCLLRLCGMHLDTRRYENEPWTAAHKTSNASLLSRHQREYQVLSRPDQ